MNDFANGLLPAWAIFARQVGGAKGKALGRAPGIMAFEGVAPGEKPGKLGLFAGEIFKPAFALLDGRGVQRPNTIDAVREKEPSVRVHQPPLAIDLFGAEETGRFELGSGGPAAVAVPVFGARVGGELGCLLLAPGRQVGLRFHFARPVLVPVLAEGVDEGEERFGICHPGRGRRVGARGANILDLEHVVGGRFADEHQQLSDAPGIHRSRTARPDRVAPHPEELAPQLVIVGPLQGHLQDFCGSGVDRRRGGHAMLRAVGPLIINPAIHRDPVGAAVPHLHSDLRVCRKVPRPARRPQSDAGPRGLAPGANPQSRPAFRPRCFRVGRHYAAEIKIAREVQEHLVGGRRCCGSRPGCQSQDPVSHAVRFHIVLLAADFSAWKGLLLTTEDRFLVRVPPSQLGSSLSSTTRASDKAAETGPVPWL